MRDGGSPERDRLRGGIDSGGRRAENSLWRQVHGARATNRRVEFIEALLDNPQRQLADRVGAEYYTFISQLETGRGRIPPDRYQAWAEALSLPPRDFVREILRFYDPITHAILFSENADDTHKMS